MKLDSILLDYLKTYDNFYLYDENRIAENLQRLHANFPQVYFLYSIKCNPDPRVLHSVFSQGLGADAASLHEVDLARQAGLSADEIYYSAPGKSRHDIEQALGQAVLIADSLGEIQRIQTLAEQLGRTVNIGIRINPDFTFTGLGGQPSKFGIDKEQALAFLKENPCRNVHVTGIHTHLKSQELNAGTLAAYYQHMFLLAEEVEQVCGPLDYINMGSGMGIPYSPGDIPLDVAALGVSFAQAFAQYHRTHPHTTCILEVGRYAVCESGVYVTTVLDRKVSRGKTYLILKNTLNGFLRPSLAHLITQYSPEAAGAEPLFTAKHAFEIRALKDGVPCETVTLVGNLCTAADTIAEEIRLPHLEAGDAILITNAGSYAAALSPMQFSSQEKPREFFLQRSGEII